MTSEIQVFSKDLIKLNILQEVLSGMVKLSFQLNNGTSDDFATSIHKDGKRVLIYDKFNISEDPTGEVLTIRPIMIDSALKIMFHASAVFSGKKASVIRGTTKVVEKEYEINNETAYIEFVPQGKQSYLMKVVNGTSAAPNVNDTANLQQKPRGDIPRPTSEIEEVIMPSNKPSGIDERFQGFELNADFNHTDERFDTLDDGAVYSPQVDNDKMFAEQTEVTEAISSIPASHNREQLTTGIDDEDLRRIEQDISAIERQQGQLSRKKQSAIEHLEKIESEYQKDYLSLEKELDEIKSRMEADSSVIEHYKDHDVTPIEIIFQEMKLKLDEAEQQIRLFIEAKQKKTMEIENEIKSNKK